MKSDAVLFNACLQLNSADAPLAPQEDRIIAEYLLIKNDEKRYLKTANKFPVNASYPAVPDSLTAGLQQFYDFGAQRGIMGIHGIPGF